MAAVTNHNNKPYEPLEYSTEEGSLRIFGFWLFLAADMVLFACLFATYLMYIHHTAGGPSSKELFEVKDFMIETVDLLVSSFTCGLATLEMRRGNKKATIAWLIVTLILGLVFIGFEVKEFTGMVQEGATLQTSAFLTSFFILVGTHGCHVSIGILWMLCIIAQLATRGINAQTARKVFIIGLYWHFLDVIWIFLFTAVYLTGLVL
ncbi:cytochrome aa3-600 menaquinol oxidase subunit 3 [Scopulibacillus daqui]|uniref:Quinol oxidase subunit 3 n=1 Tax=Scopulibacillus daqui TaxID=1469162 RepID=A0ABS2Q2Z9_9BACL|nr:cytochrome aa3 quinol oxidase subunit III [Scopulibacillus daqui]MBM7646678.1 cytochrome aa3-600 menaquinol oxidase subunit 3 [Scopulibacillus daqui]